MAREEAGRLPQVLARVGASHGITDLACKLRFYDDWAPEYDQDVAALKYRAPCLAVDCLSRALRGPPHDALILDVACGTGLVAVELQARGFLQVQGVDGSPEMLKQPGHVACTTTLASVPWAGSRCPALKFFNHEAPPIPTKLPAVAGAGRVIFFSGVATGTFDAVIIVGALSEGQVPCSAIPELLRVTKPGGLVCLTTRTNPSNLPYKEALEATLESLEQAGAWERLVTQPVEHWELATSEQETGLDPCANEGFISGIIYLYRKQETAQGERGRLSIQPLVDH